MKQIKLINLENVSEEEAKEYRVREAVRAVIFDTDNLVPLIYSTIHKYAKIPGGGIESGENHVEALKRECLEEIGCNVEVTGEVGVIVEYRSNQKLKQISYCYTAKIVGEKGVPHLDEGEVAQGFETVWLPFSEAVKKVEDNNFGSYESNYMVTRDVTFLNASQDFL